MTSTRWAAATVTLAAVLGVAGCSGMPPVLPPTDDAEPAEPHPLLEPACGDLLGEAVLTEAFGVAIPERDVHAEGYGGFHNVSGAALDLAGATRCAWGDGDSAGDHYLDLDVLPAAAEEWTALEEEIRLFETSEGTWGELSWMSCSDSGGAASCRVDVLTGGNWLSATAYGLVDTRAIDTLLVPLVDAFGSAVASEPDWEPVAPITAECENLLPVATVGDALDADVDVWQDRGAVVRPVRRAAFDRVGGLHCSWRNDFGSDIARTVELAVLPGGGRVWESHFAAPVPESVEREPLDGVGDAGYTAEYRSPFRDTIDGVASVLVGTTWIDVWINDEQGDDDRAIAERLVTDVAQRIGS